jgi:hypothetical protein
VLWISGKSVEKIAKNAENCQRIQIESRIDRGWGTIRLSCQCMNSNLDFLAISAILAIAQDFGDY